MLGQSRAQLASSPRPDTRGTIRLVTIRLLRWHHCPLLHHFNYNPSDKRRIFHTICRQGARQKKGAGGDEGKTKTRRKNRPRRRSGDGRDKSGERRTVNKGTPLTWVTWHMLAAVLSSRNDNFRAGRKCKKFAQLVICPTAGVGTMSLPLIESKRVTIVIDASSHQAAGIRSRFGGAGCRCHTLRVVSCASIVPFVATW